MLGYLWMILNLVTSFSFINTLFYQNQLDSIYKCIVLNEYLNSLQIENEIQELKLKDLSKPQNQINTNNIINQKVVHFLVSIAKDKGKILSNSVHCRQSLCRFLGRPQSDDKKLNHIDLLMPNFISEIHQELIGNLIIKGHSIMMEQLYHTFALNFQGFIFPVNLYLDNIFHIQDDFCINATLLKIDSPNQFIIFDKEGKVQGISENIFRLMSDCDEHILEDSVHLNFLNQNKQQKYTFNLETLKNKIMIYFLIPKLVELIISHRQNQMTSSEDSLQKLSSEQFIRSNTLKKQEQVTYKQRAKIKIPSNLMKLLNQFQNYQGNIIDRPRTSTYQKINTLNTDVSNTNAFFDNLKLFFNEMKKEWSSVQCKKIINIKFNLYFDSLHYLKNHNKMEKQYYCMEIVDITQDNGSVSQTKKYDNDNMKISSSKDFQFFTKNHISSSDSSSDDDEASYYKIDTLRFNQSPKRSSQAQRPSQIFFSNKKNSIEEGMNNHNSFTGSLTNFSPTIQSPKRLHLISNLLPNIAKTNSESVCIELKSPQKLQNEINSLTTFREQNENMTQEYLSPRLSERHNLKIIEEIKSLKGSNQNLKRGPKFTNEQVKIGSQSSIKELSSKFFSQNTIEEENTKIRQISSNLKSLDKETNDNNKSIVLDLNPLSKYIKINFDKQAVWQKSQEQIVENKPQSENKSKPQLLSQNTYSSHNLYDEQEKRITFNKEENKQEQLEFQLFGQMQGKSQSGISRRSRDSQLIFEIAHQKKFHSSIYSYFISMGLFVSIFYLSAVILDLALYTHIDDMIRNLKTCLIETNLNVLYSTQALFSILAYEIDIGSSFLQSQQQIRSSLVSQASIIETEYNLYTQQLFTNYDLNLYLTQNKTETSVFSSNNQQVEVVSSQLILMQKNLYNIIQTINGEKIQKNNMNYLLANIDLNNQFSEQRIQNLFDSLDQMIDHLKNTQITFIIVVTILILFLFALSLPHMKRYHKYKQQLLLLVSRMTQYECEKQLSILQQYNILLSDNYDEKWIVSDFVGVALRISKQENFKVKAQKKDQQLSTLILNQNLSKKKESLIVITALSTIVLFFAIIMIIIYVFNVKMSSPIQLYRDSLIMTNKFYNQKTIYEQLTSQRVIQSKDPHFQNLSNSEQKIKYIDKSLDYLQEYTRNFLDHLNDCNGMKESNTSILQNTFTENLCPSLESTPHKCSQDDSDLRKGLQGILQYQIEFLKRYDYLILNTLPLQEQITEYKQQQASISYYQILIDGYQKSTLVFKDFLIIFYTSLKTEYQNLLYIIQSYLLGVSSFIGILYLISGITMGFQMQNRINHLRFSLTFLPYDKSFDESTQFILKGLQKI